MNKAPPRMIGRRDVDRYVHHWIHEMMIHRDPLQRAHLTTGPVQIELAQNDIDLIRIVCVRYINFLCNGSLEEIRSVTHSSYSARIDPQQLIDSFRKHTKGIRPVRMSSYPHKAVPLSVGLWIPIVLDFDGKCDDQLFSIIVWFEDGGDWKITSAIAM